MLLLIAYRIAFFIFMGCSLQALPWMTPSLSHNAQGQVVAVWSTWDSNHYIVYRGEFSKETGWNLFPLDLPLHQHAFFPRVSMNNEGKESIAWTILDGNNSSIVNVIYPFGSTATNIEPLVISLPEENLLYSVPFINDLDVCSLFYFTRKNSQWNSYLLENIYNGWEGSSAHHINLIENINPSPLSFVSNMDFFSLDSGVITLSLITVSSPDETAIYVGGPHTETDTYPLFLISSAVTPGSSFDIGTDPSHSNVSFIWEDYPGLSLVNISAGGLTPPLNFPCDNYTLRHPKICRNNEGEIAWISEGVSENGRSQLVFANTQEGVWSAAEPLPSSPVEGDSFSPQMAMDASGSLLVVWVQKTESASVIYSQSYSFEEGWSSPQSLSLIHPQSITSGIYLDDPDLITLTWKVLSSQSK